MKKLSKRQEEALQILTNYIDKHGYSPSNRELAELMHLNSHSTVHGHLVNLQNKGYIEIVSKRAIKIIKRKEV